MSIKIKIKRIINLKISAIRPILQRQSYNGKHVGNILERSKRSTHYLGDKNRFDVSSKGPTKGLCEPCLSLLPLLIDLHSDI